MQSFIQAYVKGLKHPALCSSAGEQQSRGLSEGCFCHVRCWRLILPGCCLTFSGGVRLEAFGCCKHRSYFRHEVLRETEKNKISICREAEFFARESNHSTNTARKQKHIFVCLQTIVWFEIQIGFWLGLIWMRILCAKYGYGCLMTSYRERPWANWVPGFRTTPVIQCGSGFLTQGHLHAKSPQRHVTPEKSQLGTWINIYLINMHINWCHWFQRNGICIKETPN